MAKIKLIQRLYVKISSVIALIAMLISALASYFAYEVGLNKAQDVNVALVNQLAKSVTRTAAIAAYVGDEELATEISVGLASNNLVSSASISSPPSLNVSVGKFENSSSPVVFRLSNPFNEEEHIGLLKVYPDTEFIKQGAIYTARQNVFLLLSLSLITAIFVSIFIHSMLTRPIRNLTYSVERVNPRATDSMSTININYRKPDEIGTLISGINALISALKLKLLEERGLREKTETLEKRFRLIFEQASAGIAVIDSDNKIMVHNQAFEDLMSFDPQDSKPINNLFLSAEDFDKTLQEIKDGENDDQLSKDLAVIKKGEIRYMHCLFANITDEREVSRAQEHNQLVQLIIYDITDRMRRERKTRFEADHDSLTQLKNRRAGEEGVRHLLLNAQLKGETLVAMMIDLDKFKPVNDTYGHDVGDDVLRTVASCIRYYFDQQTDVCVRWGGDEFLIGFNVKQVDREEINALANNLLDDLSQPIELEDGPTCQIGASIGVVFAPQDTGDFDDLISKSDSAMYYVKNNGRNQVCFYADIPKDF